MTDVAGRQTDPPSAPELMTEVMTAGPGRGPVSRRALLLVCLIVLVGAAGLGGWRWYVAATDVVTIDELQASYDTMINGDGRASTGRLSPRTQDSSAANPLRDDQPRTKPEKCSAVTDATVGNVFPNGALEGVVSYQGGSMDFATGLLSYRFPTVAAARTEFGRIEAAGQGCDGMDLDISEPWNTRLRLQRLSSEVPGADQVADVMLQPPTDMRSRVRGSASLGGYRPSYELTVARYKNVLSWQYSYRSGPGQPEPDHRLLDTLSHRLVVVDRGH